MRPLFIIITAFIVLIANNAVGHAPECEVKIAHFEKILSEIGEKHRILLSFSEENITDSTVLEIEHVQYLKSLPLEEHLRLIRSVNDLANCLRDNAHAH